MSILFLSLGCGYPDVDDVPDFTDIDLNSEEIIDYCNNIHLLKNNVDKCINDYNNKNNL